MNKYFNSKLRWIGLALSISTLGLFMSCGSDDSGPTGPVASFQFEVSASNFLEVAFTNFSQNATSYDWDFGDGIGVSIDENPTYVYTESGTFTVTLTASNDEGDEAVFSDEITITDPDEALTLLAGATSKSWKLLREGAAVGVGPDFANFTGYFSFSNDGTRPCFFDDEFTFTRDGGFEFNDANTFWGEGNVWTIGLSPDLSETCFEPTTANMTVDGVDYSAWSSSNTHTYTYSPSEEEITLTGEGAWMGLVKLGTDAEVATPQTSVTMNAVLSDGGASGVDTLDVSWIYDPVVTWRARYVSYANASDEPDLVALNSAFSFDANGLEVTFTNTSNGATSFAWDFGDNSGTSTEENPTYTYAADGTYTVTLETSDGSSTATSTQDVVVQGSVPAPTTLGHTFADAAGADFLSNIFGASTITLGVDDPENAANPKVGQLERVAGTPFQEAIISSDPQAKFLLSEVNTMTIDVYLPSSNDYTGSLTQGLVIGFSDQLTSPNGEWFNEQSQWSSNGLALDTWHTLTFDLTNAPEGGSTGDATARTDLDMFFLGIGGSNHSDGGIFYIRNLSVTMQ